MARPMCHSFEKVQFFTVFPPSWTHVGTFLSWANWSIERCTFARLWERTITSWWTSLFSSSMFFFFRDGSTSLLSESMWKWQNSFWHLFARTVFTNIHIFFPHPDEEQSLADEGVLQDRDPSECAFLELLFNFSVHIMYFSLLGTWAHQGDMVCDQRDSGLWETTALSWISPPSGITIKVTSGGHLLGSVR